MLEAVANAASALGLERTRVLVAVSGGIDSSCLLDVLCELRGKLDLEVAVARADVPALDVVWPVEQHCCPLALDVLPRHP